MGLLFVLLIWAVFGSILASIGAACFGGITAFFTRTIKEGRRRTILIACLFPFLCLGWGACVFVFQAVVNEVFLNRDLGIGDTWHCPLPNGYQIMMIDVTDQGSVYNPKTQQTSVGQQNDAVLGVRTLQISGPYILGGSDSKSFEHAGQDNQSVDAYFMLDTRAGKRVTFDSFEALRAKASELSIRLDLQPIYSVYSKYRFGWFEIVVGILFCGPPIAGIVLFVLHIRRLRRLHRVSL
jgi:hypothetical protein